MANLKGGSYLKQAKDGFHRVEAFGVKRYGSDGHLTHSDALAAKRDMFFRDIVAFAEENKFSAKLNVLMGNQTVMDKFFDDRIKDLSSGTAENYLRGFSSLLDGLREKNVTIDNTISKDYFNKKVDEAKVLLKNNPTRMDRAIDNPQQVIKDLYQKSFQSGVVAEVLNELGIRISEAYTLIENPQKYIKDEQIVGLVGKGNHIYLAKNISTSLFNKIQKVEKLQEQNTFRNHLKSVSNGEHKVHDFRFTFANKLFHEKLAAGVEYKTAMREVSKELNHSRAEMTNYYLARA